MEQDNDMIGRMRGQWGHSWRMRLGNKGWLRPTVLKVLEEEPLNGIGIMNKIQEMSHGWWRPSPGSIYPLLETLCTEGMIKKRNDGKYELTRKYTMASEDEELGSVLTNIEGNVAYLEETAKADKKKISDYKARIAKVAGRLEKLG